MKAKREISVDIKYDLNRKTVAGDLFLTIAICTLIALILTLLSSDKQFLKNFVLSQSFGITICLIVLLLMGLIKPQTWMSLLSVIIVAVVSGAAAGMYIGITILENILHIPVNWPAATLVKTIVAAMIFSAGFLYIFITRSRLKHRQELIEEERIKNMSMQKEALEANLRMLQAQIEPHFLFNTLSNVISLIDTEPARGKAMLLDLTKYLRTSLSRTLPEKTTLGQEADMIKAYLSIQKIRMGERLNFKIDIPDMLRDLSFPPMLLQPLVENAVRHGLEPKIEGGEIFITAVRDHDRLRLEVADTGLGFSSFTPNGVGLANVRERLNLLFGDQGKFMIEENHPSGVKAAIEVPLHD
jgi:hypothetical protein